MKEQSSGLYAQHMAERGFVTLAFDPSFTGESGGEPRRMASPDINTEDFLAAVVMFTNAYALLNPDREEAVVLVKRMQEDLEYFRRYAMPDPNRSRDTKPDGDDEPQPATPAE